MIKFLNALAQKLANKFSVDHPANIYYSEANLTQLRNDGYIRAGSLFEQGIQNIGT